MHGLPARVAALENQTVQEAFTVGLAAFALQLFVDFHFKIPALAMTFATLAGFLVSRRWPVVPSAEPMPRMLTAISMAGAAAALVLHGVMILPAFRAESLRYAARQAIDRLAAEPESSPRYRADLERARVDLGHAGRLDSRNAQTWSDLAYATALWGHVEPDKTLELGKTAEAEAAKALALSHESAEFYIRHGVALDMQGRWFDAGEDFSVAANMAPKSALVWYHQAYHWSLNPREKAMTEAMLAFCLRLDPGNRDGIALRQRLAFGQNPSQR
jgi:hypothetical protein